MAFDENHYKQIFEQRYGAGSFDSGLKEASQVGQLKVQADVAKRDYTARLRAQQAAAKKAQKDAEKAQKAAQQQETVYGGMTAKEATAMQKKAQAEGRGGYQPSYANVRKEAKATKEEGLSPYTKQPSTYDMAKLTPYAKQQLGYEPSWDQPKQKKSKKKDKKSGLGGLLDKLKNSEVGKAATAAEQFFNPFDKVPAKDAVNNYLNHKQSKTFQEVARGANRAVDSASIGAISNLDKKLNNRTPYYNSARPIGQGGGTDMITSGLGFLAPGAGIVKAVKEVGLGAKAVPKAIEGATKLEKLLRNTKVLGQLAKEGAITGGALTGAQTGINYALNPKDQSLKSNLENIGLGIGLGAVGDPLLHGLGGVASKQWGKLAKGEVPTYTGKPSQSVLDSLKPKNAMDEFKQIVNTPSKGLQAIAKKEAAATTQLKPGRDFLPIEQQKFGTKLARAETAPENKFNFPYKPGDPLPDTRSHIGTKTVKTLPPIAEVANKGYIKTVDNLHRLSQFDNQVKSVLGRDLKPTESTHMLGLNSRGSDMISKQILTESMVNKNGEAVGKSLKDITMQVPKGKLKDFEDYLVNKHAITRMERGETVFPKKLEMSPEKSVAKVGQYETNNPEFKDLANQYYDYNKQLGQHWLVDTGVLSKADWEGYLKANPHYVPNNRIFKDIEKPRFGGGAKKGFANQTNPMKAAPGSEKPIVSPIESTIEHTAQYVKTAKRNEVMQTLINNIKQNPEAFKDWAEIVPTDKTPSSIMDDLQNGGVDGVLENINKGFDQKPDLAKGNIVTGIVDGQKVHVKVNDPHLLDAITSLTPKAQGIVIHSLGQITRVMKNLTTGINPVFSLTRNIFRDIPTANSFSKSTNNPLTFSKDLISSVISVVKNDELYRSFKAVGGGHSSPISSDVNLLAQSKRSILPREKGLLNATKHYGGKALGVLENVNNAVEAAPRLAEFKRIAKNGGYDNKMKALYEANDVTVNFNKYGNWSKEVDAVIPYFNAAIQGLDKAGRVFFGKSSTPTQRTTAALKAFTGVTIPTIVLYAINHDNPDYQKVSNYIKDSNFLIPKGDGTFYKVPKPRELGVVFGSDVERTLRMWVDQDPKAFQDFATTIKDNFVPPKRTVLDPFNDLRANKNFMDAPIIPGDLQNVSPQYQYDSKTSEVSKKLGGLFGFSPMKADYLAKSYGGIIGELGIPATTKDTTIGQTLKQKVTVDPVFSNDLQRRFYDTKTKLDNSHFDLTKQGVNSPGLNESLRKQFSQTSTQMGKVRKQMKQIQNNQSLSPQQRLEQMRGLQDLINRMAAMANKNAR